MSLPGSSPAHGRSRYSAPTAVGALVGLLLIVVLSGCHGKSDRSASPPCPDKPSAANTGPSGPLKASSVTVLDTKQTLKNVRVQNLLISGDDVTVRNVEVTGGILVKGDGATIDHVKTTGIAVSSASGTTIERTEIANGQDDAVHLTSDAGRQVRNITMRENYIHSPRVADQAHYDGTQVRGVHGLTISCSTYDAGQYRQPYNAAIYIEDANGGNANVSIEHNWLYGFGFSVMIGSPGTRLIGNHVGGDIQWNLCYLGNGIQPDQLVDRANVQAGKDGSGPMCADADEASNSG